MVLHPQGCLHSCFLSTDVLPALHGATAKQEGPPVDPLLLSEFRSCSGGPPVCGAHTRHRSHLAGPLLQASGGVCGCRTDLDQPPYPLSSPPPAHEAGLVQAASELLRAAQRPQAPQGCPVLAFRHPAMNIDPQARSRVGCAHHPTCFFGAFSSCC